MKVLHREQKEKAKEYASRLLSSMFQEVYAHTGREMPEEMFDRVSDFVSATAEMVDDEYHVVYKGGY